MRIDNQNLLLMISELSQGRQELELNVEQERDVSLEYLARIGVLEKNLTKRKIELVELYG